MKGDFSRVRFSPEKQYTAVLQQQGRVALDADANEQCAINNHLRDTETLDIVGRYGYPAGEKESFKIRVQGNALEIGWGRYYVNGILCENHEPLAYGQQRFLIQPSPTDAALLQSLIEGQIPVIQVYLEVWQRLVTPLDDPCLREPALGQADTTARLQTVWRVVATAPQSGDLSKASGVRHVPSSNVVRQELTATKLTTSGGTIAISFPPLKKSETGSAPPYIFEQDCCAAMRCLTEATKSSGKMSASTGTGGVDCSCQPTPAAGYVGLENQLYRVEIHQGGDETQATFKWSRENASVLVGVTATSGSQVYVDGIGFDANLGFSPGQWVELSDDSFLFGPDPPNQPGNLYQIKGVTPETLSVTMEQTVAPVDPILHASMRRWDQFGSAAGPGGISLPVASPYPLENSISVQFTRGQYEPGDYWLIPARTATGEIEWPPCDSDGSNFQPPRRIQVFRAPLACIQWDNTNGQLVVHDCRDKFYPLTELTPPPAPTSFHVTKINWSNDDVMTFDQLVANGLAVTLDQAAPDSKYVTPANFAVILEVALPVGSVAQEVAGRTNVATRFRDLLTSIGVSRSISLARFEQQFVTLIRFELVLDGKTSSSGSNLTWQAPWEPKSPAETETLTLLELLLLIGAERKDWGRVRVKLVGSALFAGGLNQVFLDGQSFGAPTLRADGKTPRVDLQFPSGSGAAASDFDSWFYLAPTQYVLNLNIDHNDLLVNPDGTVVDANNPSGGAVSPQATVTLLYPVVADASVTLSISGPSATGIFSIPQSVTVPEGSNTQTFQVTVQGNPGPVTDNWQIIATLTNALHLQSSQQCPFAITGSRALNSLTLNYPDVAIRYGNNRVVEIVDAANPKGGAVTLQGTVTLSNPAPTSTTIALTSSQPAFVTVSQNVSVPANQTQATFSVKVAEIPRTTEDVDITATLTPPVGSPSSKKATLRIRPLLQPQ